MTPEQEDGIFKKIEDLAMEVESDQELAKIDQRYQIAASWIDLGLDNISN